MQKFQRLAVDSQKAAEAKKAAEQAAAAAETGG
jgi:hypothetical protein